MADTQLIKLSPSDLTYAWKDCKRCFWLKATGKMSKPWSPMPGIFTKIDGSMKAYFQDTSTERLAKQLGVDIPAGKIRRGQEMVKSAEIMAHGKPTGLYLSGKIDSRIIFEDGTIGIPDFKTSKIDAAKAAIYAPQLRAYAYCIEHPAGGKEGLMVSLLALIGFSPERFGFSSGKTPSYGLTGSGSWAPIDLDREAFEDLMAQISTIVNNPEPPSEGSGCGLCQYRKLARELGF
ncbi:hypothetical protein LCGC14_0441540 [marine sediment metagenome]|uniref:PD-(D/E)XK endonuclease-like domain-containing protein n=1 Tax=marine sediment metagenome TaxID=412755 RepID=A0A0F9T3L2_9ZZZZ